MTRTAEIKIVQYKVRNNRREKSQWEVYRYEGGEYIGKEIYGNKYEAKAKAAEWEAAGAPRIEFVKEARVCPHNTNAAASGEAIIYDYAVIVDGARRATLSKCSVRRGWQLLDEAHRYINVAQYTYSAYDGSRVATKAQFIDAVTKAIQLGLLPTSEEITAHIEKGDAERAQQEALQKKEARLSRIRHHGVELMEALELLLAGAQQVQRAGVVDAQINGGVILAQAVLQKINPQESSKVA